MSILTVDVGTTSVKVALFGNNLSLLVLCDQEYDLQTSGDCIVETPPGTYWSAVKNCISKILGQHNVHPEEITAIAITTQGETIIPVDKDGNPLSNAVVWLDSRASEQAKQLRRVIPEDLFYEATGLPEITSATPLSKIVWFMQHRESAYENIHKFLLLEDYLVFLLTGKFVSEHSLLSSSGYLDIRRKQYSKEILRLSSIDINKLPDIRKPASIIGKISKSAARETGLSEDTLVASAAMDQICGMIGTGNIHEGIVTETTGTCLTVGATVTNPTFDKVLRPMVYTHFNDKYVYLPYNQTAGIVLKWFKDKILQWTPDNTEQNVSYNFITDLASQVPVGADGNLLLPHFAGKLVPSTEQDFRGTLLGMSLNTSVAHMARAILEGVAYMLRENVEYIMQLGIKPKTIRSLGGGSKSDLWCQIKADVLNVPTQAMQFAEGVSRGAAMLAKVALGDTDCINSALDSPDIRKNFVPDPQRAKTYDQLYERYRICCEAVSNLYSGKHGTPC